VIEKRVESMNAQSIFEDAPNKGNPQNDSSANKALKAKHDMVTVIMDEVGNALVVG
jgi:hypothetical protein